MLRRKSLLLLLLCAIFLPTHVRSQEYPARPIRLIVAYAPGATDAAARAFTKAMSALLGQPIIIENKPGANAGIGTSYVEKAVPDGYTLLYTPGSSMLRPHLVKVMYDPFGFTPIGRAVGTVNVLVINAGHPAKTVSDLVAYAKANPGKVTTGGTVGASAYLAGKFFESVVGAEFLHVQYKGTTPAMVDLLAGRLTFIFSGVGHVLANVKAGKLRTLGVTGDARHFQLPDTPTLAEAGLKNFDFPDIWHGLVGPLKMQRPVVDKLSGALRKALAEPESVKAINALGYQPRFSTPEELAAEMRRDYDNWGRIVKVGNTEAK